MPQQSPSFIVRPPYLYVKKVPEYAPPANSYIVGTWHVTHSSRSYWRGKHNASITYEEFVNDSGIVDINEVDQFQTTGSNKVTVLRGVNAPIRPGAWRWQARNRLAMVASRRWEIIGFGNVDNHRWLVNYFAESHLRSAGIDILSRKGEGLPEATFAAIVRSLKALENKDIDSLAEKIFELRA